MVQVRIEADATCSSKCEPASTERMWMWRKRTLGRESETKRISRKTGLLAFGTSRRLFSSFCSFFARDDTCVLVGGEHCQCVCTGHSFFEGRKRVSMTFHSFELRGGQSALISGRFCV